MGIKKTLIIGVLLAMSNTALSAQVECIILEPSNQTESSTTSIVFDHITDTIVIELDEEPQNGLLLLDPDSGHSYTLDKSGPSSFNFTVSDESTITDDDSRTTTPKVNLILEIGSDFTYIDQVNLFAFYCRF